ncbi:MAG TPA: four helix bundle protein, partial [Phycisphaerales bacterium]|nr:four helix bundle protein [Phycisphaerales bacterium]
DTEMAATIGRWMASISPVERADPLWGLLSYRTARYALHLATADVRGLAPTRRELGDQLIRAVASIGANLGEGYSRPSLSEQARFYSYALGSTREAISWYVALEDVIGTESALVRAAVLGRVRRLTFGMLRSAKKQRGVSLFRR